MREDYTSHQFFKILILCFFKLCCVFVATLAFLWLLRWRASLPLQSLGFSLQWLLLLESTGSREADFISCGPWALEHRLSGCSTWTLLVVAHGLWSTGSVVAPHGLCCSAACGIFLDQGSNPCNLHWQVDSSPLDQQGSPPIFISSFVTTLWGGAILGTRGTRD